MGDKRTFVIYLPYMSEDNSKGYTEAGKGMLVDRKGNSLNRGL